MPTKQATSALTAKALKQNPDLSPEAIAEIEASGISAEYPEAESHAQPPKLPTNPNIETVTFETPIERGNQTIESVSINKPKAGALRGLSLAKLLELDVDTVIKLVPRVSTPPLAEHEVANADPVDLMQLSTAVIGFFASREQKAKAAAMEQ